MKNNPYITFHSSKIMQTGPNTFDVPGTLTIRGVSKPEKLTFTVSGGGTQNGELKGIMAFNRKEYGMNSGIPFIKSRGPCRGECRPKRPENQWAARGVGTGHRHVGCPNVSVRYQTATSCVNGSQGDFASSIIVSGNTLAVPTD